METELAISVKSNGARVSALNVTQIGERQLPSAEPGEPFLSTLD
jgi:hypothetical protein